MAAAVFLILFRGNSADRLIRQVHPKYLARVSTCHGSLSYSLALSLGFSLNFYSPNAAQFFVPQGQNKFSSALNWNTTADSSVCCQCHYFIYNQFK
jgi:hypothetical protein